MALTDIKDAGILAGFVHWGYPYHGLITGGTIGTTGHSHPQPLDYLANGNNVSWLIDMGLPAITLTTDETTFCAANNMEWRNYALIAGGYAYGTYIGDETYIHIDDDGKAWRVALAYSFPAADTLRITATIQRFGYLRVDGEYTAPAAVIKTADVTCAWIHLTDPFTSSEGPYLTRSARLQDVHTNGSKALIGVFLRKNPGYGFDYCDDLFSCVDLVITGAGGESGSTLAVAGSEVIPMTNLRERTNPGTHDIDTYARYAFYDSSAVATAVRLRVDIYSTSSSIHFKFSLLENTTVIDDFGWDWSSTSTTAYGSLAAYVPAPDAINGIVPNTNPGNMIYPFRSIYDNRFEISTSYLYPASATGVWFYGLHRMPSKAVAFVAKNAAADVVYGTVSTPRGSKTTSLVATLSASLVNFAYQRKTGAYTFASTPICYV